MGRDSLEYGDFQTPEGLALRVCRWLREQGVRPEVLIEPTFGQGHFILAALAAFPSIRHVYGVEIHEPYFREAKKKIDCGGFCDDGRQVQLFCEDVFRFSFAEIAKQHAGQSVLLLGNPPWVTNSLLGSKDSVNIPAKSNFKNVRGLEAMTGRGNFDLGESVVLSLLNAFAASEGHFAMLLKNTVVKNVVELQERDRRQISDLRQIKIDSLKEFGAAVDAGLFYARLGGPSESQCRIADSFEATPSRRFGWCGEKFVADIDAYERFAELDGRCPTVWRQGLKHDCAAMMELIARDDHFENKSGQSVQIETDLVYPLLKSSDLKTPVVDAVRKFVIVPQRFVGEETEYIRKDCPKTFEYLNRHKELFERRKSSIYKGKPPFSIFGIGDYSFRPYKVAISGLYKQTRFSQAPPFQGKPVMLDDTCYFLGFDSLPEAALVGFLLNRPEMQNLLRALIFWDGKRIITKDILMRLDYSRLFPKLSFREWETEVEKNGLSLGIEEMKTQWEEFARSVVQK